MESPIAEVDRPAEGTPLPRESQPDARFQSEELLRARRRNIQLLSRLQDCKGDIITLARVRPEAGKRCVEYLDDRTITVHDEESRTTRFFSFNHCFPLDCSHEDIFFELEHLTLSMVEGYQVAIFAYGQTGSGKTYTMIGTPSNPGILFCLIPKLLSMGSIEQYFGLRVTFSMVEVYNEEVYDLLSSESARAKLDVTQNAGSNQICTNCVERELTSLSEAHQIFLNGMKQRSTAATILNDHSSRSHCIMTLRTSRKDAHGNTILGRLNLIDLAGSECVSKVGGDGDRLVETQNINLSLFTIGEVIQALSNKSSHIPYRNSKLTYLLRDCLSCNSKVTMIFTVRSLSEFMGETLSTVSFSKKVQMTSLGKVRKIEAEKRQSVDNKLLRQEITTIREEKVKMVREFETYRRQSEQELQKLREAVAAATAAALQQRQDRGSLESRELRKENDLLKQQLRRLKADLQQQQQQQPQQQQSAVPAEIKRLKTQIDRMKATLTDINRKHEAEIELYERRLQSQSVRMATTAALSSHRSPPAAHPSAHVSLSPSPAISTNQKAIPRKNPIASDSRAGGDATPLSAHPSGVCPRSSQRRPLLVSPLGGIHPTVVTLRQNGAPPFKAASNASSTRTSGSNSSIPFSQSSTPSQLPSAPVKQRGDPGPSSKLSTSSIPAPPRAAVSAASDSRIPTRSTTHASTPSPPSMLKEKKTFRRPPESPGTAPRRNLNRIQPCTSSHLPQKSFSVIQPFQSTSLPSQTAKTPQPDSHYWRESIPFSTRSNLSMHSDSSKSGESQHKSISCNSQEVPMALKARRKNTEIIVKRDAIQIFPLPSSAKYSNPLILSVLPTFPLSHDLAAASVQSKSVETLLKGSGSARASTSSSTNMKTHSSPLNQDSPSPLKQLLTRSSSKRKLSLTFDTDFSPPGAAATVGGLFRFSTAKQQSQPSSSLSMAMRPTVRSTVIRQSIKMAINSSFMRSLRPESKASLIPYAEIEQYVHAQAAVSQTSYKPSFRQSARSYNPRQQTLLPAEARSILSQDLFPLPPSRFAVEPCDTLPEETEPDDDAEERENKGDSIREFISVPPRRPDHSVDDSDSDHFSLFPPGPSPISSVSSVLAPARAVLGSLSPENESPSVDDPEESPLVP